MTRPEVESDYEKNTGLVIVETFRDISPSEVSAVLVANHGPFTWGPDAPRAIENARVLEYLARLEWRARTMVPDASRPDPFLIARHFLRKHRPLAPEGVVITYDQFLARFGQKNDRILRDWLGPDASHDRIRRLGDAKEAEYRRIAAERGLAPLPGAAGWGARLRGAGGGK